MKLSFHGAVEEVTGSCFLIETAKAKVLVDCGMKQGERMCVMRSLDPFGFDPKTLDAVLVTHAHFDHTGRLPELIKNGYTGPIYSTAPTKALADIILEDSLKIMGENAKRCGDPVPYEPNDKFEAFKQWKGVGYHTQIEVAPGVMVMFHDAGHILGSSFVTVKAEGKTFAFSGDLGNEHVPILPETERLHKADYVICESTYGDTVHEPPATRREKLKGFAEKILGRGGTLVIPAFSIERTQELLYEFDTLFLDKKIAPVPIYLDSPMAIRATAIYRHFVQYLKFDHPVMGHDKDFFSFPTLRETLTTDESKAINLDHRPKIIIAGNGMMTGGRVLHHLKRYVSDPKSGLLVVGYQAAGTLGRKIQERQEHVRIYGEEYSVQCELLSIEAFSAHGDKDKITRWLQPEVGQVGKIFLVHGDQPVKEKFAEHLRKQLPGEIIIPHLAQSFEL